MKPGDRVLTSYGWIGAVERVSTGVVTGKVFVDVRMDNSIGGLLIPFATESLTYTRECKIVKKLLGEDL